MVNSALIRGRDFLYVAVKWGVSPVACSVEVDPQPRQVDRFLAQHSLRVTLRVSESENWRIGIRHRLTGSRGDGEIEEELSRPGNCVKQ